MRHTARRESLEGKPQARNEEEEKKEWIGQNGEKRKERKVNVVYSGRKEERREKRRKPSMGAFGRQGTSVEGDLCFLGPPSSSPSLLQRSQVPSSTSYGLQLSEGSSCGRCWRGRHGLSYTFQGQVEFTERLTERQMQTNQGKDQETDTQIQEKHNPAPTGQTEQGLEEGRGGQGRRVELQMSLGPSWLWSGRGWTPQMLLRP